MGWFSVVDNLICYYPVWFFCDLVGFVVDDYHRAHRGTRGATGMDDATMNYETATEIERQVAFWFGIRTHIIVPNVSWSMLPYEADMVILHQSRYADEVEIKISRSDLLRDKNKRHQHDSNKFRRLWFAIPRKLELSISDIPTRAGVLIIENNGGVNTFRNPEINKIAVKFTEAQALNLARLGCMRMWYLKNKQPHDETPIDAINLFDMLEAREAP